MKYFLYLCIGAVMALAFIDIFRFSIRDPKRPVTGKNLSRLAALTLAVLSLAFFWTYDGAMTLSAQMTSVGDTAMMIFFGEDDTTLRVSSVLNETGTVEFALPGGAGLKASRLDPVTGEGDLYLSGMQLNLFGIPLEDFTPEQLYDGMRTDNIPVAELTEEGIHFVTEDNDPIFILPEEVTADLDGYLRMYSVLTLVGSAALGLLAGWLLAGKRTRAFFDRCAASARALCRRHDIRPCAMVIAVVHFWFCFYLQHAVFYFERQYLGRIVFYECLFFFLLQILWQVIFRTVKRVKQRDQATIDFLKFSGIYFGVMFTVLLLIWPGYMVWDEYCQVWRGLHWEIQADYHFLLQDPFTLAQMLVPGIAGANLYPCFMISGVVCYVLREIYTRCGRTKWVYLLYIPLLFPAMLFGSFDWQKSIPNTAAEILLLCKVTSAVLDDRKLTKKDALEWSALTAVAYTLRTDGFYYVVLGPVIFILLFHKKTRKSTLALLAAGIILLGSGIQAIQNHGTWKTYYSLLNYTRLAYAPIMEADPVEDAEELAALNKVFDVEKYQSVGTQDACYEATESGVANIHNDEEFSVFKKNIIKLMLKHPGALLHQQIEKFLITSGFGEYLGDFRKYQFEVSPFMDPDSKYYCGPEETKIIEAIDSNPLNKPINEDLRSKVQLFLMGRDINDYLTSSIREPLFCNLIPSFIFILALGVYLLLKRKYKMLGIYLLFALRLPIMLAAASYVLFHYFYRFFAVGNVLPFFALVRYLSGRSGKKQELQ